MSAETAPAERAARSERLEVRSDAPPIVIFPDEFLAYVEILQLADPEAHADLSRELAEAEPGPAFEAEAARLRRSRMLDSLAAEIAAAGGPQPEPPDAASDSR